MFERLPVKRYVIG